MKPGPKKSAEPGQEVKPITGDPTCPKDLGPVAKAKWRHLVKCLKELNVLSRTDNEVIEQYARLYERYSKAEAVILADGITYTSKTGMRRPVPEIEISNTCQKLMKALLDSMGLTPAARAKVNANPDTEADDPFKDFD